MCGFIGIFGPDGTDVASEIYEGLLAVQHRGQDAAGIITFLWPGVTAVTLLYIIAFWAILAGALQIAAAIRLRKEVEGEWLWILSGACMILLGMLLMRHPEAGAVSVMWLIGAFAMAWGVLLVILAFRLKGHLGKLTARTT